MTYERHRVGIDEYHRMVEAGVFDPDSRLELIDGELIERMSPIDPPHASATSALTTLFIMRFGLLVEVRCRSSITLPNDSEPQPDIVVARYEAGRYASRHPGPEDTRLVVEVADSSLAADRKLKLPLYADAGITEVWLVDLVNESVIVHREPRYGEYCTTITVRRGETVAIEAFPDEHFAVNDFLPPL